MVRNVIWDFDGVIVISDAVREKGFRMIFENFASEYVEKIIDYHKANGGLSRYNKIRFFYENIIEQSITNDEVFYLADQFSRIMRKELTNKQLLNCEWLDIMAQLPDVLNHHIASGSDEKELIFLCKELEIIHFFKSMHGSPTPKTDLVKNILINNHYAKDDTILVGDAINDYKAATENGISFFGYNNVLLEPYGWYLDNLKQLQLFL